MRRLRRTLQRTGGAPGLLALAWLLAGAVLSVAQSPMSAEAVEKMRKTKAPEDWTIEERLAVRFDPGDMRLRLDADHRERVTTGEDPATIDPADDTVIVDGAKNPELILPWELFHQLISKGFSTSKEMREYTRGQLKPVLKDLGIPEESFWPTLEKISGRILEIRRNLAELTQNMEQPSETEMQSIRSRSKRIQATLCRDRVEALSKAHEAFGSAKLDHLLYRGVAPYIKIAMPYNPIWHDDLLSVEEGCGR